MHTEYSPFISAPHFVIFSTRIETFCWKNIPSWPFTAVVLGTQVIALVLSVYGFFGYSDTVGSIGWPTGLVVLGISLATFLIADLFKVWMIHIWDTLFEKRRGGPVIGARRPQKSRAQRFMQRQRAGYDRAQRRESLSSIVSY